MAVIAGLYKQIADDRIVMQIERCWQKGSLLKMAEKEDQIEFQNTIPDFHGSNLNWHQTKDRQLKRLWDIEQKKWWTKRLKLAAKQQKDRRAQKMGNRKSDLEESSFFFFKERRKERRKKIKKRKKWTMSKERRAKVTLIMRSILAMLILFLSFMR